MPNLPYIINRSEDTVRTIAVIIVALTGASCNQSTASSKQGAQESPAAEGAGSKGKEPAQRAGDKAGKPYAVSGLAPSGASGQPIAATIKLVPRAPYKVNLEYPTKLTVEGPAAAAPAKQVLKAKDATRLSKAEAVFKPTVKIQSSGKHSFSATFKFSVCTKELCELKTEKLSWVAAVK